MSNFKWLTAAEKYITFFQSLEDVKASLETVDTTALVKLDEVKPKDNDVRTRPSGTEINVLDILYLGAFVGQKLIAWLTSCEPTAKWLWEDQRKP